MITGISKKIDKVLTENNFVTSFLNVKTEDEFRGLLNSNLVKSVGYMVKPTKVDCASRNAISEVTLFVVDISNDDVNVNNSVMDSSLEVVRDVLLGVEESFGDAVIETDFIKESENDSYTVIMTAKFNCMVL